jgi:hypothetical protein
MRTDAEGNTIKKGAAVGRGPAPTRPPTPAPPLPKTPLDLKEARILRVEPGDIIVLETDQSILAEEADYLALRAKDEFGVAKVIVLSGCMHAGIIRLVDGNEIDDD